MTSFPDPNPTTRGNLHFYKAPSGLHEKGIWDYAIWVSQVIQWQRIPLPMQEMQEMPVRSLSLEDLLEEEMVTHSSILAWIIPWTEEPGGLQFMGSQEQGTTEQLSMHYLDSAIQW